MKPPETFEEVVPYALKVLSSGSGATVDDPFRLDHVHPLLAKEVEGALVSTIFNSTDWSPGERLYHKNGQVFEWRIKRKSGDIDSVFFDISQVNNSAPLSEAARQEYVQRSDTIPVPDTTLVSRFPLTKVEARSAAEAADFISSHIERAVRDGWQRSTAMVLVDGWRNDYVLTRGDEKTMMSFDMRPCLVLDRLELTILTLSPGSRKGENFGKRTPEANPIVFFAPQIAMLLSRLATAAITYYFTHSVILSIVGFFIPDVLRRLLRI